MAMKSSKVLILLLIIMAIANINATLSAAPATYDNYDFPFLETHEEPFSLRGAGRFLAAQPAAVRAVMTCDKYPTVCRAKGSPGPDCCNKQCVNVMTDKLNCGMCGKKCGYSEMCCQGECVNPSVDEKHCGKCNNKCMNGNSCTYGLCSYAN